MKREDVGRRERRKIENQQRIIAVAEQQLRQLSLEDVSVEAICKQAEISKKTFYSYFSTLYDVIDQISQSHLMSTSDKNYALAINEYDNTKQRITYFLKLQGRNLSDSIVLEQNLIKAALIDVSVAPQRSRAKIENTILQFEKILEAGRELGDVNEAYSTRFLAETLSGIVNNSAIHWIHLEDYPVNQRFAEIKQMILDIALKPERV